MVTESSTSTSSLAQPAQLCGYAVVEPLTPGVSYLAIGPGGRGVALKKLDPDCLHGGLLHPDVRDRLSRVRELAHRGVANLFGVAKDEGDAWLMWEYIEGRPFPAVAAERSRTPREMAMLVRELVLTIESLHMQGIVHGSIHGGNVIVSPEGSVRLTDVSPLLYVDPEDDIDSLHDLIAPILESCGQPCGPLARLMAEARGAKMPLRGLAARLAVLIDSKEGMLPVREAPGRVERRLRRRTLVAALLVAAVGGALAYGVWRWVSI